MAELRVPTLQHLARNWRNDPAFIASELVRLVENPPQFSYAPLFGAVRDLLILGVPYEQIVLGIQLKVKRDKVRDNLLSVLPLLRNHFEDVRPDFCQTIDRRFYPVGRGLMVPFDPPMLYGVGGQLYFPWFSFWKSKPLGSDRLSLFVTLVDEILLQDPDLETTRFQILDFSSPGKGEPRELSVIEASEIPRIENKRKAEMLEVFAEGYFRALDILTKRKPAGKEKPAERSEAEPSLFPDLPGL